MFDRKNLGSLVILLLSLCMGLLLSELILRASLPDSYYVLFPNLERTLDPAPGVMIGVEDKALFKTNAMGLRGRTYSTQAKLHIVTVGASTTQCLFLDQSETWQSLLEASLNAKLGPDTVWIGNAGKDGATSEHHVLELEKLSALVPRIDIVFVLMGGANLGYRLALDESYATIDRTSASHREKIVREAFSVYPSWDEGLPFYKRTAIWQALRRAKERLLPDLVSQLVVDEAGLFYVELRRRRQHATTMREQLPDLSQALADFKSDILKLAGIANRNGFKIVFLTQPSVWRTDLPDDLKALLWAGGVGPYHRHQVSDYYSAAAMTSGMKIFNAALMSTCEALDADCFDIGAAVPKDTSSLYDQVHLNEAGARTAAALLERFLFEHGYLQPKAPESQ